VLKQVEAVDSPNSDAEAELVGLVDHLFSSERHEVLDSRVGNRACRKGRGREIVGPDRVGSLGDALAGRVAGERVDVEVEPERAAGAAAQRL
jgi:FKBP-type peptidyl-prolyl cis-trans isomerase 2